MRLPIAALSGAILFLTLTPAAHAASNGLVIDSCKPNDWNRFGEAVETMNLELLAELARDPEMRNCEFAETARVLLCAFNPIDCVEPAAGPELVSVPVFEPPLDEDQLPPGEPQDPPSDDEPRSDPPGAHIGVERDHSSDGGSSTSGGGASSSTGDAGGSDDGKDDNRPEPR